MALSSHRGENQYIMECLFKSVLDRHPKFSKKETQKQKDPTAGNKREKILKAM